ncbi:deoxyguanosinetriphosphate triphosphohydrolase [Zavarzinia compransoris]|uniref:Deoxyguanosinetriphosphate triphosphohydrolase-like protein n=1 Tax=Zavarzinia compransoris TaxID=1264899 RepID=A0A317EEQ5_9PROT|nr:deoxyguanosinetriphosphate triphosphohydrolase [Zavarzinia compransoris]PWR23655.1 deoxyguanosinetriphosphate triphosphohydrolase [Zavarzinia compransoris]TDP47873.1 dGTPase [Zavarzinia compransoris]
MTSPPAIGARAPYASDPRQSRGRRAAEPDSPTRSPFQRDRDRIIHSGAFRRLQYKTQVFIYHEGDHYRTRLTHSLEVAQIARSICRVMRLDEDLGEALALAHDLGHTCFGHAGEDALDHKMAPFGGFDHNAQTLRILTKLEKRFAEFDGLNLTWETLEGVVKHNGPLVDAGGKPLKGDGPLPAAIVEYMAEQDLELATHAGPEAQVAALADDIAYNNHDIDDGLRAGLFRLDDLRDLPLVGEVLCAVEAKYPGIGRERTAHETVRALIGRMVDDVLTESRRRLAALDPRTVGDIRRHHSPVISFSPAMAEQDRALKAFLWSRMYRHDRVNRMTSKARRCVRDLFDLLLAEPQCLPADWAKRAEGPGTARTARLVADFIAGMTDRFAIEEHARLFDISVTT